jgi:predicted DCC family thiol-disulfide oxidoreductase YuxK
MNPTPAHPIILFDADCSLCNTAISFIRRHDRRSRLHFIPLQSPAAAELLHRHNLAPTLDTVVLVEGSRAFTRSTAALRIARHLHWPWPLLAALLAIPALLRDPLYTAIARRRHRLSRAAPCPLPPR